jgi:hypothetical protein
MTPVHGLAASIAPYAELRSATTEAATGATIDPVIVHPVLVIELNVEPTSPLMAVPGPVSVQVTVPTVGWGSCPGPRRGAAVPRFGATWDHAGMEMSRSGSAALDSLVSEQDMDLLPLGNHLYAVGHKHPLLHAPPSTLYFLQPGA